MITSTDNPKVKWLHSLQEKKGRRHEMCFQVEGAILLETALSYGLHPRLVLYDGAALRSTERGRQLIARLAEVSAEEVTPGVLAGLSGTVSPQGVIAAFPIPRPPDALPDRQLVVVLDGVRDPGNAGTILRSAQAAGCAGVLATTDTVDLFSPKVVRAGMGAHFALPMACDLLWPAIAVLLEGRRTYVAQARTGTPYYEIDWTEPSALVIGNETEGARPQALQSAAGRVSIPMPGQAESLNAAVAASIVIFESVRHKVSK
jgi:RNA methyltransferase, TrmH family